MTTAIVRDVLDEYYTGKYREDERDVSAGVIEQAGGSQRQAVTANHVDIERDAPRVKSD